MTIWANCIVNNEENFVWFAITSIIDYVDRILIYDTGSSDKTVEIIEEIKRKYGNKINFKEVGIVDKFQFTKMRQQMLDQSNCDWILILDGDEVWWKDSIKKVVGKIEQDGDKVDGIVVPIKVVVGDIYHLQEEEAGQYNLFGKKGHLSLKAFRKNIPGLYVGQPYGKEGFFDSQNKSIQEREKVIFLDAPLMHLTYLRRSSKRRKFEKIKSELGDKVSDHFKYPEVLSLSYPKIIPSPWVKISGFKLLKAQILTPLRKIKRRIT